MENKEFYLEGYNYKYNSWLPLEIIEKLDDKVVKVRYYVYKEMHDSDGTTWKQLVSTFETATFCPSRCAILP